MMHGSIEYVIRQSQVTLSIVILTLAGLTALLTSRQHAEEVRRDDVALIHALVSLQGGECHDLYGTLRGDLVKELNQEVQTAGYEATRTEATDAISGALGLKAWRASKSGPRAVWSVAFFELDGECPADPGQAQLTVADALRRFRYLDQRLVHVPVALKAPVSLCKGVESIECKDPQPIVQLDTNTSSGFEQCAGGYAIRRAKVECVHPQGADAEECAEDDSCSSRADCLDGPYPSCSDAEGACACHYGCRTDIDCKEEGEICVCAGVYAESAVCMPAALFAPWYCEREFRDLLEIDLRLEADRLVLRLKGADSYEAQTNWKKSEISWPVETIQADFPGFAALSGNPDLVFLSKSLGRDEEARLLRYYGNVPLAVAPGLAEASYTSIFQDVEVLGFNVPASTAPVILLVVLLGVWLALYSVRKPPRVPAVDPPAEGLIASLLTNGVVRIFTWVLVPLVTLLFLIGLAFPA